MTNQASAGQPRLRRDGQQWNFDRAVKDTGRVFHFQASGRGPLPEAVRSHEMISKHLGKSAIRLQMLAAAEAAAGHDQTALDLYFEAAAKFAEAQHPIFVNNDEKRFLHGSSIACYDEVRARSPYVIEHVDVPWNGTVVSGNLHLAPVEGPAPCVFFIPGCDMTKEMVPHPRYNYAAQRGMHVFVFDGPGQGESNLRDIALTTDNYESAASAALDYLVERPEIDAGRIALFAISFGSYWGVRFAATDARLAAVAMPAATVCDMYHLMEEESPRYKQLFAYLTRARSEDELDRFIGEMDLRPLVGRITAPTLVTAGEYDPRSPLQEVYEFYDSLQVPRELWVYSDQHHMASRLRDTYCTSFDWLRDRLDARPLRHDGKVLYLQPTDAGPNDPEVHITREWFRGPDR